MDHNYYGENEKILLKYLNENGPVGVRMGVDGASGPLPTNIATEGHEHPPTRRFGEEGPGERRNLLHTRSRISSSGDGRTFHAGICRPTSHRRRTQHQSHRLILKVPQTKTLNHQISTIKNKNKQLEIEQEMFDYLRNSSIAGNRDET